jgi:hypothetical protein
MSILFSNKIAQGAPHLAAQTRRNGMVKQRTPLSPPLLSGPCHGQRGTTEGERLRLQGSLVREWHLVVVSPTSGKMQDIGKPSSWGHQTRLTPPHTIPYLEPLPEVILCSYAIVSDITDERKSWLSTQRQQRGEERVWSNERTDRRATKGPSLSWFGAHRHMAQKIAAAGTGHAPLP